MIVAQKEKMSDTSALKHQFKGLSVRGALICLQQKYGKGNMSFVWRSQFLTIKAALKELPGYLLDMRCGEFGVVRFYGGPPAKGKWFDGSILTMLCDATLFEKCTKDIPIEQLLGL